MGYGDYTPSGGGRPKPLTKAQIKKLQQAYLQAGVITEEVKILEEAEQKKIEGTTEELLKLI